MEFPLDLSEGHSIGFVESPTVSLKTAWGHGYAEGTTIAVYRLEGPVIDDDVATFTTWETRPDIDTTIVGYYRASTDVGGGEWIDIDVSTALLQNGDRQTLGLAFVLTSDLNGANGGYLCLTSESGAAHRPTLTASYTEVPGGWSDSLWVARDTKVSRYFQEGDDANPEWTSDWESAGALWLAPETVASEYEVMDTATAASALQVGLLEFDLGASDHFALHDEANTATLRFHTSDPVIPEGTSLRFCRLTEDLPPETATWLNRPARDPSSCVDWTTTTELGPVSEVVVDVLALLQAHIAAGGGSLFGLYVERLTDGGAIVATTEHWSATGPSLVISSAIQVSATLDYGDARATGNRLRERTSPGRSPTPGRTPVSTAEMRGARRGRASERIRDWSRSPRDRIPTRPEVSRPGAPRPMARIDAPNRDSDYFGAIVVDPT